MESLCAGDSGILGESSSSFASVRDDTVRDVSASTSDGEEEVDAVEFALNGGMQGTEHYTKSSAGNVTSMALDCEDSRQDNRSRDTARGRPDEPVPNRSRKRNSAKDRHPRTTTPSKVQSKNSISHPLSPFSPLLLQKQQRKRRTRARPVDQHHQPNTTSPGVPWQDDDNDDQDTVIGTLSLNATRKVSVIVHVRNPIASEKEKDKICLFPLLRKHDEATAILSTSEAALSPTSATLQSAGHTRELIVVNPTAFGKLIPSKVTMETARLVAQMANVEDWARSFRFQQVMWPGNELQALQNLTQAMVNDVMAPGSIASRTILAIGSDAASKSTLLFGSVGTQSIARVLATTAHDLTPSDVLSRYGLIGIAVSQLLDQMPSHAIVTLSVLEIAPDDVLHDLLAARPFSSSSRLQFRYSNSTNAMSESGGGAVVHNLTNVPLDSLKSLGHLLRRAFTAARNPKRAHSPAHIMATLKIWQSNGTRNDSTMEAAHTVVQFGDIVNACTNSRRDAALKQSVTTLGGVLRGVLLREAGNDSPWKFRESSLTKVLQRYVDHLDGKVVMLACTSPLSDVYDETLATLRFVSNLLYSPNHAASSPFHRREDDTAPTSPLSDTSSAMSLMAAEFSGSDRQTLLTNLLSDPRQRLAKVWKQKARENPANAELQENKNEYTPTQYELIEIATLDRAETRLPRAEEQSSTSQIVQPEILIPTPIAANRNAMRNKCRSWRPPDTDGPFGKVLEDCDYAAVETSFPSDLSERDADVGHNCMDEPSPLTIDTKDPPFNLDTSYTLDRMAERVFKNSKMKDTESKTRAPSGYLEGPGKEPSNVHMDERLAVGDTVVGEKHALYNSLHKQTGNLPWASREKPSSHGLQEVTGMQSNTGTLAHLSKKERQEEKESFPDKKDNAKVDPPQDLLLDNREERDSTLMHDPRQVFSTKEGEDRYVSFSSANHQASNVPLRHNSDFDRKFPSLMFEDKDPKVERSDAEGASTTDPCAGRNSALFGNSTEPNNRKDSGNKSSLAHTPFESDSYNAEIDPSLETSHHILLVNVPEDVTVGHSAHPDVTVGRASGNEIFDRSSVDGASRVSVEAQLLRESLSKAKAERDSAIQKYQRLEEEKTARDEEEDFLLKKLRALTDERDGAFRKLEDLERKLTSEAKLKSDTREAEWNKLTTERAKAINQIEELEASCLEAQESRDILREALEEREEALRLIQLSEKDRIRDAEEHDKALKEATLQIEVLQDQTVKMCADRGELVKIAEEAIGTNAQLEQKIVELEKEVSTNVLSSVSKDEVEILEKENLKLSEESQELRKQLSQHKLQLKENGLSLSELTFTVSSLEDERAQLLNNKKAKDDEIRRLKRELTSKDIIKDRASALQRQLEHQLTLGVEWQQRETDFNRTIQNNTTELEQLESAVENLQAKLDERNEMHSQEVESDKSQIALLLNKVSYYERERLSAAASVEELELKLGSEIRTRHKLSSDLKQAQIDLHSRLADVQELSSNLKQLLVEKDEDERKVARMQLALQKFQSETRTRVKMVVMHRDEAANLLDETLTENRALTEKLQELRQALEETQHARVDWRSNSLTASRFQADLDDMVSKNKALSQRNQLLETQVEELLQQQPQKQSFPRNRENDNLRDHDKYRGIDSEHQFGITNSSKRRNDSGSGKHTIQRRDEDGFDHGALHLEPFSALPGHALANSESSLHARAEEVAAYLALSAKMTVEKSQTEVIRMQHRLHAVEDTKDTEIDALKRHVRRLERHLENSNWPEG